VGASVAWLKQHTVVERTAASLAYLVASLTEGPSQVGVDQVDGMVGLLVAYTVDPAVVDQVAGTVNHKDDHS
jgi:hypothetical protein